MTHTIDLTKTTALGAHHNLQQSLAAVQRTLATEPGLSALEVMDLRDQRDETKAIIKGLESHERFNDLDFSYVSARKVVTLLPYTCGPLCYCVDCLG